MQSRGPLQIMFDGPVAPRVHGEGIRYFRRSKTGSGNLMNGRWKQEPVRVNHPVVRIEEPKSQAPDTAPTAVDSATQSQASTSSKRSQSAAVPRLPPHSNGNGRSRRKRREFDELMQKVKAQTAELKIQPMLERSYSANPLFQEVPLYNGARRKPTAKEPPRVNYLARNVRDASKTPLRRSNSLNNVNSFDRIWNNSKHELGAVPAYLKYTNLPRRDDGLTELERAEILYRLKLKEKDLLLQLNKLPVRSDTPVIRRSKSNLETQLRDLDSTIHHIAEEKDLLLQLNKLPVRSDTPVLRRSKSNLETQLRDLDSTIHHIAEEKDLLLQLNKLPVRSDTPVLRRSKSNLETQLRDLDSTIHHIAEEKDLLLQLNKLPVRSDTPVLRRSKSNLETQLRDLDSTIHHIAEEKDLLLQLNKLPVRSDTPVLRRSKSNLETQLRDLDSTIHHIAEEKDLLLQLNKLPVRSDTPVLRRSKSNLETQLRDLDSTIHQFKTLYRRRLSELQAL